MKENKYDEQKFFDKYSQMSRSTQGLDGAGEWHELKKMLPKFSGKKVLDLGCGYGWHCKYAVQGGASSVIGVDLSSKMIEEAKARNSADNISYVCGGIEDINYPKDSFDVIISSLTFHYIESFQNICDKVSACLCAGGDFVFSVEHPIFTAYGSQDWIYDASGAILHWPVDNYFSENERTATFLGEKVVKYHKTLTTYINTLITSGFCITGLVEPMPSKQMLDSVPGMSDELRRPMMLLISACKK